MVRIPGPPRLQEIVRPGPAATFLGPPSLSALGGGQQVERTIAITRQAAEGSARFAIREEAKFDQMAIFESDSSMSAFGTTMLHNPEDGLLNTRGKNSFGVLDSFNERWDSQVQDVEAGLSSTRQRAIFRQRADSRKLSIERQLMQHVSAQSLQHDAQLTEAFVENEGNAAALAWETAGMADEVNPETGESVQRDLVEMSLDRQREGLISAALRQGTSAEVLKLQLQGVESATHVRVIEAMTNANEDVRAAEYFEKKKGRMLQQDIQRVQPDVEHKSRLGEAQRFADDVMDSNLDQRAGLEAAREEKDPELRKMKVQRVRARFAEEAQLEAAEANDRYMSAVETVNGMPDDIGAESLDLLVRGWGKFDATEQAALKRLADPKHNERVWREFFDTVRLNPKKIAAMTEREYQLRFFSHFDRRRRETADSFRLQITRMAQRGANATDMEKGLTSIISPQEQFDNAMKREGLLPRGKSPNSGELERSERLEKEYQKRLNAFEEDKGKSKGQPGGVKANREERKQIIQQLFSETAFLPGILDRSIFADRSGETLKLIRLDEDDFGNAIVPIGKIPKDQVDIMKNVFRSNLLKYTDELAEQLYFASQFDDDKRIDEILKSAEPLKLEDE